MVLQLATFSVVIRLPCGGFDKRVLDEAISGPPAGFAVWSLEPEKLEHFLYHLNGTHHNIKFTIETGQYSELPSYTFMFIGDLMCVLEGLL